MNKKIGIIGLGTVGRAVLKSLSKQASLIRRRTPLKIEIKKVCDVDKSKKDFVLKSGYSFTSDPFELINDPQIDIIVELIGGIEPAKTFILEALKKGKDVVTANKALLATSGRQIFALAEKKNKCVGFEASVCGAIPIIKSISEGLIGCEVKTIYGILNGTTNYILYKMRKEQIDFDLALKEARSKGLVEKHSKLDIDGIDALHKLCILSYLCYGVWPSLKRVYTEGISKISLLDILYAEEMDYRIKLFAVAKKQKGLLDLRVHPTLVPTEHPLAHTSLAYNAVHLNTYPAGELLFYGEGAGGVPTSSSVISDIVSIASGNKNFMRKENKIKIKDIKDIKSRYYIRFMAQDSPGVLADVSQILSSFNISIASVSQKEQKDGKYVPVVIITHEVKEDSLKKAIIKIDNLKKVKKPSQIIRIEDL